MAPRAGVRELEEQGLRLGIRFLFLCYISFSHHCSSLNNYFPWSLRSQECRGYTRVCFRGSVAHRGEPHAHHPESALHRVPSVGAGFL